ILRGVGFGVGAKVSSGRVSHSSNIPVINLILIDNIDSCRITSITSPLHFFYSIQNKNNFKQIYYNVVRNNRDKRFYLVQIINHYRAYNTSNCETNMNRVISPSSNVNLKKRKLMYSIECLANEIIYDIFSYFDACDAYYAFSNLNNRFQNLLDNASLFLKITYLHKLNSALTDCYKQIIHQNKHNIISLHFCDQYFLDQFIRLCAINSSFTRLQSIILHEISTFKFMVLLVYFKSIPCLSSLTVCFGDFDDDLGDVYQIIFHLSSLKYFKLKILEYYRSNLNIPIAINEQFSSLQIYQI
ncbi:unnamed protein product, partial [Rotaria sordida]